MTSFMTSSNVISSRFYYPAVPFDSGKISFIFPLAYVKLIMIPD